MTRTPNVPLRFLGQRDPATGRPLCCYCGAVCGPTRRSWCSDECVQTYQIAKGDQNAARRWCWSQDRGVCRLCGTDTVRPHELARPGGGPPFAREYMPTSTGEWEADHTVPICEGGALARENLRTLCRPCHRAETKALAGRRAARRRAGESVA